MLGWICLDLVRLQVTVLVLVIVLAIVLVRARRVEKHCTNPMKQEIMAEMMLPGTLRWLKTIGAEAQRRAAALSNVLCKLLLLIRAHL